MWGLTLVTRPAFVQISIAFLQNVAVPTATQAEAGGSDEIFCSLWRRIVKGVNLNLRVFVGAQKAKRSGRVNALIIRRNTGRGMTVPYREFRKRRKITTEPSAELRYCKRARPCPIKWPK